MIITSVNNEKIKELVKLKDKKYRDKKGLFFVEGIDIISEAYNNKFMDYLSNDLNTANVLTLLYDLIKDEMVNGHTKLELIKNFDKVLSLDLVSEKKEHQNHEEIMKLIKSRDAAKKRKDYELADSIRDELLSKGIMLIDTREGTTYKEV